MTRKIPLGLMLVTTFAFVSPLPASAAAPSVNQQALQLLLQRADYWKDHGRMDLAASSWKQVLAADPGQPRALAGLAENAARAGQMDQAAGYLARLRTVAPQDPAIPRIESLLQLEPGSGPKLARAARAAADKHYQQAVSLYDQVFHGQPPAEWAKAYYDAMAQTSGGRTRAIAELRRQVASHPHADGYQLVLGRLLTEQPATRDEGIDILRELASGPGAQARQARSDWAEALGWMGDDPSAIPALRAYLSRHRDAALTAQLQRAERAQRAGAVQRRHGDALRAAYADLHADHFDSARSRFRKLVESNPHDADALAGLGYVDAAQQHYSEAIDHFDAARKYAASSKLSSKLDQALLNARHAQAMQQGEQASRDGDDAAAEKAYARALQLEPHDPASLLALAAIEHRLQRPARSQALLTQAEKQSPRDPQVWLQALQTLQGMDAPGLLLDTAGRMPGKVRERLESKADYVGLIAWAEARRGDRAQAIARLRELSARMGSSMPVDQQLQLGWLLYQTRDDADLRDLLANLVARSDLSSDQRTQLRSLYLNAARREAGDALQAGHPRVAQRIVANLEGLYPHDSDVQRVRAQLLMQQQRYADAERLLRDVGPGDEPSDYTLAAQAALANDDPAQARTWVEQGLKQSPRDVPLQEMLARIDLHEGRASDARKRLRAALAELPANGVAASTPAESTRQRYPFVESLVAGSAAPATVRTATLAGTGVATDAVGETRLRLHDSLDTIDAVTSNYLDGGVYGRSRSGTAGLSSLSLYGAQLLASAALGYDSRVTVRVEPVTMDAGTLSGPATAAIGTAPVYGNESGDFVRASGVGLAFSLNLRELGITLGTSPLGFPEHSLIGRIDWHPDSSPLSLSLFRNVIRDSVLSYAGVRDQNTGQTWGGVFASGAGLDFGFGDAQRLLYGGLSLAAVQGTHVQFNTRVQAQFDGRTRLVHHADYDIDLGFDLLSMFFARNASQFTYGQGGYFSPQYYIRPGLVLRWNGVLKHRLRYGVSGLAGWQVFHYASSPYFPLDALLQNQAANAYYPASTVSSVGYGLRMHGTYAWSHHLYLRAFMGTDNAQNFSDLTAGLVMRWWFTPQPTDLARDIGGPRPSQSWILGLDDVGAPR